MNSIFHSRALTKVISVNGVTGDAQAMVREIKVHFRGAATEVKKPNKKGEGIGH